MQDSERLQNGERLPPRRISAYLFDLDGTVSLGDEVLPGTKALLTALRNVDLPVRFLSNNPTKTRAAYVERLRRLGIAVEPDEIVTSVQSMTTWLQLNQPGAVIYPISEAPLIESLETADSPFGRSGEDRYRHCQL